VPSARQGGAPALPHYERAILDGHKTKDLGGELGTDAFTDAVIERLKG
jgi:hypothetical protein